MLTRFCHDTFTQQYKSTIGVDFATRTISFGEEVCKLQIWDTSGQERFRSITSAYYRGAHCVLLMYACNRRDSFASLSQWLEQIRQHCRDDVLVMVVACKSDLEHNVSVAEGAAWAEENGCLFQYTSSKNNTNVFEAFVEAAQHINTSYADYCARPGGDRKPAAVPKRQEGNVACVDLSKLATVHPFVTGEPIRCVGCGVMFNKFSQLLDSKPLAHAFVPLESAPEIHQSIAVGEDRQEGRFWPCEFCMHVNQVQIDSREELEYQAETCDYLLQGPTVRESHSHTVFVVDVSGSMSVSLSVSPFGFWFFFII
jgi:small GTP-binding protein